MAPALSAEPLISGGFGTLACKSRVSDRGAAGATGSGGYSSPTTPVPAKGLAALAACLSWKSMRDLSDLELQTESSSLALMDGLAFVAMSADGNMLVAVLRYGIGLLETSIGGSSPCLY